MPLDARLGMTGYFSPQARRLVCLAGASWPFGQAACRLHEFAGLQVSDETIRQACHAEAGAVATWRAEAAEAVADFQAATGEVEFQTDAAKVNTTEGWRDMKIGIYAKRPRGVSATPEEWAKRVLPETTARHAFAAIQTSNEFGSRWGVTARRLGIETTTEVHVLGDGGEWIWNEAAKELPWAKGTLDIFHAVEHVSDAAKEVWGEGSAKTQAWTAGGRMAMLRDGWWGLCAYLGRTLKASHLTGRLPKLQTAVDHLTTYFSKHTEHLKYCWRLRRGQSIGSGMVEGAAKNLVGRRLKQTGARWKVEKVNKMAQLCCSLYSSDWDKYWEIN